VIDFDAINRTPVTDEPFRFLATQGILSPTDLAAITADFPAIHRAGVFPLSELSYGPAFAALIEDIRSSELEDIMSEKFGVDLSDMPLMITVRGHAHRRDGRIHTDSETKVVTCLLYLNDVWDQSGGRLRMLRSPDDLNDYAAEVPPNGGTLAAFVRTDHSWHGHEPFEGQRRYVMFNWMSSHAAMERELGRHRFSAKLKQLNPFG
jgi:SM-20-related protein